LIAILDQKQNAYESLQFWQDAPYEAVWNGQDEADGLVQEFFSKEMNLNTNCAKLFVFLGLSYPRIRLMNS
jgi:hypothetical protein